MRGGDWASSGQGLAHHFADVVLRHDRSPFLTGAMLETLTVARSGSLQVVWAPFEHVNVGARLVVVGITPGRVQAENALAAFRAALRDGYALPDALRVAKATGSFSGPIRRNLVAMLDHVGANTALGVPTTMDLFDPAVGLMHPTSALRYPVLRGGANYSGSPHIINTPLLRGIVEAQLVAEADALGSALWVPLGAPATVALDHLAALGRLSERQVLHGLPHPSGANAERIAYFLGRKDSAALSSKTRPEPLDAARETLTGQLLAW